MNKVQVIAISAIITVSISLSVNLVFSNGRLSEYGKTDIRESDRYLSEGITLYKLNFYRKSIKKLKKSIKFQPDYSLTHSMLGRSFLKSRKFIKAKNEFREAIQLNPESYVAHCHLASILIREDSLEEARKILKNALRINPHLSRAGELLKTIENNDEKSDGRTEE